MVFLPPAPAFTWDHNAWYHRLLLRRLPTGSERVLDAGCGAGALAAKLARRVPSVDAIDRDPRMVELATARVPTSVRVVHADLLTDPLPGTGYDAIVSLSVLHHLPLEAALPRLAAALRPGGRLVAIALPRVELPQDLPVELAACAAQAAVGLALAMARLTGARARRRQDDGMPVADPVLTVRQVREQARRALPGARVRRLLFWRYLLVWDKPSR